MYISRLVLGHSRMAALWVSNPYRVHQRLEMACGDDPRVLFRIEFGEQRTQILVQTVTEPNWPAAFTDFALLETPPEQKAFSPLLTDGAVYRFRLLANPTIKKTVEADGASRKTRLGLMQGEQQMEWIRRKLNAAGAELVDAQALPQGLIHSHKNPQKDEHGQTHYAVLFEGLLRMKDASLMSEAIQQGLGPAKAYGFGLLSLAAARTAS